MSARETEYKFKVPIIDNNEWEPDMDFYIDIYDVNTGKRLSGDDTRCTITILDEDFPGQLGFDLSEIRVTRDQAKVDIKIVRNHGSDGEISCMVQTKPLTE